MAGLHILKYSENLSDERLCELWAENPYYQYFCGEEFFRHRLVFDRSSMTRFRQRAREQKWCAVLRPRAPATKSGVPSGRRTGGHFA
jgi:IS5 family transposase